MMQTIKHILSISLVALILFSGLPVFSPEDATRDSRVDLADAILNIKGLAQTAEQQGSFSTDVENAILSLQVLAGLNTFIKSANNTKNNTTPPILDYTYLISTYSINIPLISNLGLDEEFLTYKSLTITPNPPPPRRDLFC